MLSGLRLDLEMHQRVVWGNKLSGKTRAEVDNWDWKLGLDCIVQGYKLQGEEDAIRDVEHMKDSVQAKAPDEIIRSMGCWSNTHRNVNYQSNV